MPYPPPPPPIAFASFQHIFFLLLYSFIIYIFFLLQRWNQKNGLSITFLCDEQVMKLKGKKTPQFSHLFLQAQEEHFLLLVLKEKFNNANRIHIRIFLLKCSFFRN